MASHPMGPGSAVPPSEWHSAANIYDRGQLMACMRAGVIALVLLGILALIVLFCTQPSRIYACVAARVLAVCAGGRPDRRVSGTSIGMVDNIFEIRHATRGSTHS